MRSAVSRPDTRPTDDDFPRFSDARKRHKIIGGAHEVTSSPGLRRQDLVGLVDSEQRVVQVLRRGGGGRRAGKAELTVADEDALTPPPLPRCPIVLLSDLFRESI